MATALEDFARVSVARVAALLLLFPISVALGAANESGQWCWDANVGYLQRSYENRLDDERVSRFVQRDLRLSYGLNGFVVHPAIARFRLHADALLGNPEGGSYSDTNRIGLGGDLSLFPRGAYPTRLFFRQQLYDFEVPDTSDPFTALAAPDNGTNWGAHLRAARGPLRNVAVGFDRSTVDFVGPLTDQTHARQYVNWTRNAGGNRHQLRLNRRLNEGGLSGLDVDEVRADFNQNIALSSLWRWNLSANGTRRELGSSVTEPFENRVYRLDNLFQRRIRDDDRLVLTHTMGLLQPEGSPDTRSQRAQVTYTWKSAAHWQISPLVQYNVQDSDGSTLRSPRAGIAVDWNSEHNLMDLWLGTQTSYGNVRFSNDSFDREEKLLAYGLSGSLAHAGTRAIQKEFEFQLAHNELRLTLDPVPGLPDLGLRRRQLGTEDSYRARISLGRHWDSSHVTGWVDWRLAESEPDSLVVGYERESLLGTLQLGRHGVSMQANVGETTVRNGPEEQEVRHYGVIAQWLPVRYLSLRGTYRADLRSAALVRDLDGDRIELGATLRLGRLNVEAEAFEFTEQLPDMSERSTRGLTWSISTQFDGWLPIFTGTRRRGMIR